MVRKGRPARAIGNAMLAVSMFLFLINAVAHAAPTYGTDTLGKGEVSIGYQNNSVFKHDLKRSYGNLRSVQHFLDLSYGVYDWLTVDGKAGGGNLRQKGGIHPKVYYNYGFAGGYGFRIKILDSSARSRKNRIKVVLGFHHISVHPNNTNAGNDKYESLLDDWQSSLVASYDIGPVTPFVGGKVSRFDLVYKVNEIDRKRRPPAYYGGVIAGCTVRLPKHLSVRVEGHFIDETSLSTGVYYTY